MRTNYTMDDFRAEMRRRGVPDEPRPQPKPQVQPPRARKPKTTQHGATIVKLVPCGVHPLHLVKVRASGGRTGCPMCEMQIESMCRARPAAAPPRGHAPRVSGDLTRVVGCSCGWRTPPGATDSDDAYVEHATVLR